MVKIREDKEFRPQCPYCDRTIEELVAVKHGSIKAHYVYACPHCKKVLGVGQNS